MKNKILILGSNGQLGTALSKLFIMDGTNFQGLDYPEIDLTNISSFEKKISNCSPDILINCAAYTDVYKAEIDIENALIVNGIALKPIVNICNENNICLCHISTDYIFDGEKNRAYSECDLPNPINIYGLSKYIGEKIVQLYSQQYVIIRTSALYGNSNNDSINIVKKIINLTKKNNIVKLVEDEFTSPTYTVYLAKQIKLIIKNNLQGVIHATSEGYCNWVEFGKYLFELSDIDVEIEEVKSSYFNRSLKKPKFSVLDNKIIKDHGINIMPHWKEELKQYLKSVENKLKKHS